MASLRGETAPVKRARFGAGILRSLPTYRLPVSLEDHEWWAGEAAREHDREVDRMYNAYRGQSRLDAGLQPW